MITKFKKWLQSLPHPESFQLRINPDYSMIQMGAIGNATIHARIVSPSWQKNQNYIIENKCFAMDGRPDEPFMCLMPNVGSVYFEVMLDNDYNKRIGMSNLVDLSKGQKESSQEYIDTVLIHKVKNKLSQYNQNFNKL
jgi:hypothetical protein